TGPGRRQSVFHERLRRDVRRGGRSRLQVTASQSTQRAGARVAGARGRDVVLEDRQGTAGDSVRFPGGGEVSTDRGTVLEMWKTQKHFTQEFSTFRDPSPYLWKTRPPGNLTATPRRRRATACRQY